MNYFIGAIGGVVIVLGVLYFVLRSTAPRYPRSAQETDWDENPHSYGGSDGPNDADGADGD